MALTQRELAAQMIAQLRVLDPSVSAEVGTPERKILDTVAQALSDVQIDLVALGSALDVDTKIGQSLDRFLTLFNFARQQATRASGFVVFSRETPSNVDIRIPVNTQVMAPANQDPTDVGTIHTAAVTTAIFVTTLESTLPAGELSVAVPIQAVVAGSQSNAAAHTVTAFAVTPVYGITGVDNPAPIAGGKDRESDDELKVRFKNTVFRNLAGTADQYIALAAQTQFTTKISVVGPISRYREYVQVPSSSDDDGGNGISGEYTTALSTVPYSKHVYTTVPNFVSNGRSGVDTIFWREEVDWRLNTSATDKNRGDTFRQASDDPPTGSDPDSEEAFYQPNLTFTNVIGSEADPSITSIREGEVVLFEHSYMSKASRNDFHRGVTNAVDVFIDGGNNVSASCIVPTPGTNPSAIFSTDPTHKYLIDNYRRFGEPQDKPVAGNLFIPLFWQPVTGLPTQIIVSGLSSYDASNPATPLSSPTVQTSVFYLDGFQPSGNPNYWMVEEVSDLYGTVRARNGIEIDLDALGWAGEQNNAAPLNSFDEGVPVIIDSYLYDKNIVDLQAAMEGAKQVTTDVLAHKARVRYFKFDVTVMYSPSYNPTQVNEEIRVAVQRFLSSQYFGNVIQLSDVLQTIHNVAGVDNVRWTSDVPSGQDFDRVFETDRKGNPLSAPAVIYNNDFFLQDDQLPSLPSGVVAGDTAPGLIIRARAQNTWIRS